MSIISIILAILGNVGSIVSIIKTIISLISGLSTQGAKDKAYVDLAAAYRKFEETGDRSALDALHDSLMPK
jgi:hypothetical protein